MGNLKALPVLNVQPQGAVVERAFLGMLRIQALQMDAEVLRQLTDRLGTLPEAGYFKQHQTRRVHWLSPQEYLLVVAEGQEQALIDLLADLPVYVSVISDSRLTLSLVGQHIPELLAQRCGLDVHPDVFAVGCSTITRMAGLPVMVSRLGDIDYEITIDRSYGQYFWDWLGSL